ncbi:MAG: diguanylate cyclase, partial [Burkholderiales bacterium]|nr:diguanylate cyclase [Burkholderiales bacterium]
MNETTRATLAVRPEAGNTRADAAPVLSRGAVIMMVDDEPTTLDVLQSFLEDAGYSRFVSTSDSAGAMALVASEQPDVVLLDLMMPQVSGFEILAAIRAEARLRQTPVIVLTSSTDAQTKLRALELGATDFLAKPVDSSELALRLRNILAAKAYLDRLTHFDALTGLRNRQMFLEQFDQALRQWSRYGGSGAVLHIDIDRFKQFNEAFGQALADQMLKEVATRLEACVRSSDPVARIGDEAGAPSLSRLGGDEFAVLLTQVERAENTIIVAKRLLDAVGAPFDIGGRERFVSCSIGISVFPGDSTDRETLLQNAAAALVQAKKRGGNSYAFH